MSDNIFYTICLAIVFLLLFISAEILYHKFKVKAEITRKYVHLSTGLLTMLFPPLIQNHWLILILCASFLLILLASMKFNLLPSINAVDRTTRGSILYPIIVYCCYLVFEFYGQFTMYYVPILILAICDPIAALVGKKWPRGSYTTFGQTKTLSGSFGFLFSALILCLCLFISLDEINFYRAVLISLCVAILTTFAEAITHKGYDNLTIPASALLVLISFNHYYLLE